MQSVGQFDEDDARVARHGQQHLAEVLCLLVLVHAHGQLADLRLAFDNAPDRLAELLLHLLEGGGGVLHRVVQQPGHQRADIQLHLGEDLGYGHGVRYERFAGTPQHAAVHLLSELVGRRKLGSVLRRQVFGGG